MTHRHTTGFMSRVWIQLDSACWLSAFWLQVQHCEAQKSSPFAGDDGIFPSEGSQIETSVLRHVMILPCPRNLPVCNTLIRQALLTCF